MKVTKKGDKLPNPTIQYNKDGSITHILHMYETDGQRCMIKRTIDFGRNPEECVLAIENRRKTWVKFGDAKNTDDETSKELTRVELVDVPFRLCMNPKELDLTDQDGEKKSDKKRSDQIIKCRNCQGSHWTVECPLKHLGPLQDEVEVTKQEEEIDKYVPPKRMDRLSEELPSIRIANLAEDTTEDDLRDLVDPFGHVARVFLAKFDDGRCKGFAFVNFRDPSSVDAAIAKLNGYGYANLILSCERSKKKER